MFRPARDFKIDRADKIIPVVEIYLDLLLAIGLCQKGVRIIDQFLIPSRWIFAEVMKDHNHPYFHLLKNLGPTTGIDLPKLGLDQVLRRFLAILPRLDGLRKLRQPTDIGILMPRKQLV